MTLMRLLKRVLCLAFAAVVTTVSADVVVLPATVALDGPEASAQLLVQQQAATLGQSVVGEATWMTSDDSVVQVSKSGVVTPVSNGTATVTAKTPMGEASTTVSVSAFGEAFAWSFRNHVLPVLAKQGCNMGACHGALAGKGGFKLSLRGYDPDADFFTMTREARGRRVELAAPARSLLLTKPSGAVAHKGGLRLPVDSHEYRVLAEWISSGAKAPREDDARLDHLEIFPKEITLAKDAPRQQIVVWAEYSDGRREDVTRWVKFSSADAAVCDVSDAGVVSVTGAGEGAVVAWFSSQIVMSRVTVPFSNETAADSYASFEPKNFVDELVLAKWQKLGLAPSRGCTDAEFIRRVSIDTIGKLPTPDELAAFLASKEPNKRAQLIDKLLSSEEFVDYWTYMWSDILLVNGRKLRPMAVESYYKWIRGHVKANTPWNQFAREVVTAKGETRDNGATNFYALHQTPEDMTENVCQAFMGLSIGCAKCHNHPLEKWTNKQYYGMANHFSRVRAKGWGGDGRNGDGLRTLVVVDEGELTQPNTGKPVPPTPLDGQPRDFEDPGDRREWLAKWLVAPENPYFTKAICNRVWANFFSVGLVENVDDLRVSNPASNEALLDALADRLVEADFDLKELMREILNSSTYQLSSDVEPGNAADSRFYSRYYPRRMMAEVLLDAITDVTEVSEKFTQIAFKGADKQKTDFYQEGTGALELYDSAVDSYFLSTFGRNEREITCDCERSDEPSMVQVLHISNGNTINEKLRNENSSLSQWIKADLSDDDIVSNIFRAAVSRDPTARERKGIAAALAVEETDRKTVLEDVFWAVLSSREFLFNR